MERADTGGMRGFGGSRPPSMAVLARADSVAGSRAGGGGAAFNRPGTAKMGPVPRRPPSIMPVVRPRTAATGGAAQAAAARPLPPSDRISAHAFRVEKKGTYQGELNVPSILFIGKAGEPVDQSVAKQKKAELSKYKLRPGALEELGIEEGDEEEENLDASLPQAGGRTSPQRKSVSYDMAPYGGKREMDSLRRQIVETETAALESRLQSQMVVSKTQGTVKMVEEKVGHVRESNQQLDSELVEIEKQIEELKRISRAQIDEIKALRDTNKQKEAKLHSEQQELQRMEGTVRDSMILAQESKQQEGGAQPGAIAPPSASAAAAVASSVKGGAAVSGAAAQPRAHVMQGMTSTSSPIKRAPSMSTAQAGMIGSVGAVGITVPPGASVGVGRVPEAQGLELVYKGDKRDKPPEHPEIHSLLQICDNLELMDGRIWAQAAERRQDEQIFLADHPSEDFVEVPPWLRNSKAPSDWSESKGSRKVGYQPANHDAPPIDMEIEHVYGYGGSSSVDSLCCTATGKLVYPAASLCVVHDLVHKQQQFFKGHSDAVLCVAMHPEGQLVASGDVGKSSKVLVWDSQAPQASSVAALWGFHQAGIACLAFSRDGNKLATVGRDVDHSLCIWDWRKEERLANCKTDSLYPVMAVSFDPVGILVSNPSDPTDSKRIGVVITAGVRHMKFWRMEGTQLMPELADFMNKGSLQTILCVNFMKVRQRDGVAACTTLSGTQDGSLYLWNQRGQLVGVEKKAHDGPVSIILVPRRQDEHECGSYALTGGADGKVRRWDAHMTAGGLQAIWTIDLEEKTRMLDTPFSAHRFPVRGISCSSDRIYVGTSMNEIYQFTLEAAAKVARAPEVSMMVMQAHTQGNVYAMDVHPTRDEFVTVGWDATLRVWNSTERSCFRAVQLTPFDEDRLTATAVQYSPDGEHLSVGFENGDLWIFDATAIAAASAMTTDPERLMVKNPNQDDEALKMSRALREAISVLRYRPDGLVLVAAGLGGKLAIFLVEESYERIRVFKGHQCNLRSIDYSEDCKMMQTTGVDNQICYWMFEDAEGDINPVPVKDTAAVVDTVWATWTSALGWPVEGIYDVDRHDQHARTSAYASRDRSLLLAWEDKDILLYNLPCRRGAAARRFKGHASVPAEVRFLRHGRGMVSVGTRDMCIIQWKPPDSLAPASKPDDEEVEALKTRCSHVRREGLVVRITLTEKSEIAVSSKLADDKWKELRKGLAELLKTEIERLEMIRVMAGSLKFDVGLLPHPMGFTVAPTAADLLSKLEKLCQPESMQINKKFPQLVGLQVVQGPEEPDDDFMGIKPWLGVVAAPTDWQDSVGSELLNYAPTVQLMVDAASADAGDDGASAEPRMVGVPRAPCLIAYQQEVLNAVETDIASGEDGTAQFYQLVPKTRQLDALPQSESDTIVIRWKAKFNMDEIKHAGPDDAQRRFVVSFFMADQTVAIYEPPNSSTGFAGGTFLDRQRCRKHGTSKPESKYLTQGDFLQDLPLSIWMNNFPFLLVESDRFMSQVLSLDFVYGYQGWRGANNLFYLDPEHVVYSASSIGVVQQVASRRQRFMRGHEDQISAVAMKEKMPGAAFGYFATGELGPRGCIRLWKVSSGAADDAPQETGRLQGFHSCDIAALCFLDTDMLVSAGSDAEHQMAVWSVVEGNLKSSARGDVNPILAVGSAGQGSGDFVSVGVGHIKFWHYQDGMPLAARGGIFGNKGRVQTMLCVEAFFENTVTMQLVALTGTEDGSIYVWKDRLLTSTLPSAHSGPVFALCIAESNPDLVLSGGKDGTIRICCYDSQGLNSLHVIDTTRLELRPLLTPMRSSVRALASSSAGGGWLRLAFGTGGNNLVQVELDIRNTQSIRVLPHTLRAVANGHAGSGLAGLCAHPDFPEFATVGDDAVLRLWNSTTHELTAAIVVGHPGNAVDYNAGADEHIVVALTNGSVLVLDAPAVRRGVDSDACTVCKLGNRRSQTTDVKYSPDGQYLAVASCDNVIDIYLVKRGYTRWGVCRGHRDTIRHLDWASDIKQDAALLRSNDTSQELLHWDVTKMHKGQIEAIERAHQLKDVSWSRGTCPMTWASQGALAYYETVTDVTAVDRSRNGALLAAADDFGSLRLFRYPALEGCRSESFRAHAGAVTNVTFTFDDSSVLSTCTADMCLFQWKVALVPHSTGAEVADQLQLQIAPPKRALAAQAHSDAADSEDNSLQLFKPFHACVFAPGGWRPDDEFLRAPKQELELEMVHGCRGHDRHSHLCYNASFHAVYYTAKIVVVQDREYGLQRFFLGHTDDISCIAPHPQGRLFASGQTGSTALICVWDSKRQESRFLQGGRQRSLRQVAAWTVPKTAGVVVMSFSSCGCLLFTVSENLDHEVTVWDWQHGKALSLLKNSMNRTLAMATNRLHGPPAADENFMTCGVKNVRFWKVVNGRLECKNADLSSRGVLSIQLSCAFSKEYAITGNEQGFLYFFKDARLIKTAKAHHGPVFSLCTAAQDYSGNAVFCTGGGDGVVKLWKLDKRSPVKANKMDPADANDAGLGEIDVHCFEPEGIHVDRVIRDLNVPSAGQAVCIRAAFLQFEKDIKTISNAPTDGVWRILLGTSMNEVYQLTLPLVHSAPDDMITQVHSGQLERETVKVYKSVMYGDEGVGGAKLPAIQLLVQAHSPAPTPHAGANIVRSLAALAVHPNDESEFATCGADGVLRIWDGKHGRVHFMCRLQEMFDAQQIVQSMCYSPANSGCYHLALGSNGKVFIMEASVPLAYGNDIPVLDTLGKDKGLASRDLVTSLKYSSCSSAGSSFLAAGVSSGCVIVYKAPIDDTPDSYQKLYRFKGHSGPVLHLDFSKETGGEPRFLQSNCSRFELRFWDLRRHREHKTASELRDQLWESLTCSLSWPALGIGPDDYAVVPCVDRSPTRGEVLGVGDSPNFVGAIWPEQHSMPLLAVSQQDGRVALGRYPCLERAELKSWVAHSATAAAVRFTHGAQKVLSIGDVDMSICQWRRQLPVHEDVEPILDVPASMKMQLSEADALFLAKDHGSHDAAAGGELGSQATFADGKPFLTLTKMFKAVGWDDFEPQDLEKAGRMVLKQYELRLDHVHGSRGHCAVNNVFYNKDGHAVYVAAGVVNVQEKIEWDTASMGHTRENAKCRCDNKGSGPIKIDPECPVSPHQNHFTNHDDTVLCIDVTQDGLLAATGQVSDDDKTTIRIWDAVKVEEIVRIDSQRSGGIYALAFRPGDAGSPAFLASVANDEDSTIDIWDLRGDIRSAKLLTCMAGDKNRILSVAWNPYFGGKDAEAKEGTASVFGSLVTAGDKHLHFWTFFQESPDDLEEEMGASSAELPVHMDRHQPSWEDTTQQTALCICFLERTPADVTGEVSQHGYTLTGMQDGSVFFWKWTDDALDVLVIKVLPTLHEGPIFCLSKSERYILSGGHDGMVKMWELGSFGDGSPPHKQTHIKTLASDGTCIGHAVTPSVRSLCARVICAHNCLKSQCAECANQDSGPGDLCALVGTAMNEIYEVGLTGDCEDRSRPVAHGHGGTSLQGLAVHPIKDWFATVGDDCVVRVWDMRARVCTHAALLKASDGSKVAGKALCFRGKVDRPKEIEQCPVCQGGTVEKESTFLCDELAVGTTGGEVVIFRLGPAGQLLECEKARRQYRTKPISFLRYSPTGLLLAVASEDMCIDVLLPDEEHRRVGVCKGHLSPICSIDWTEDGEYMQSGDSALDLIFWSLQTCTEKKVPEFLAYDKPILLRKKKWQTFSTSLGWPWQGIYAAGSEAVGLNAVDRCIIDRTTKRALGISADVSGTIRLFPYPLEEGKSKDAKPYSGHSAGVSAVRFSASGKYVVSVGGRDCSILQWERLAPEASAGDADLDADNMQAADDDSDDEEELDRLHRMERLQKK